MSLDMLWPQEHRVQFSFVAVHTLLIVGGTLLCGITLKAVLKEIDPEVAHLVGPQIFLKFIGFYGLSLLVIPATWAYLTIKAESIGYIWASRRIIFLSGFLMAWTLVFLYYSCFSQILWLPMIGHEKPGPDDVIF